MTLDQIQALTDDGIRVRVAELQGWQVSWDDGWKGLHPRIHQPDDAPVSLPNYPADLNACHEFERMLTRDQCHAYNLALCDVKTERPDSANQSLRWTWGATARARCEAFLAVMTP